MTTSIFPSLKQSAVVSDLSENFTCSSYSLKWRRDQLLVTFSGHSSQVHLPSLNNEEQLVNCLKHSTVNLVSIDSKLGRTTLKFWANACEKANKPIFVRPVNKNYRIADDILELWERTINIFVALIFLSLFSPLIGFLVLLMLWKSPGSIFNYEWCIGKKGKLFRLVNFDHNLQQNIPILSLGMTKLRLHRLPELFNILRGEASLFNSKYCKL
ncbi:MAG: heterocyst development glycosyltransferase HepC [Sphaerospermopsis sp.]|nr:heterocyst development glycosyltransferase HepC [Sphaerospermopsis sp.]